MYIHVHEFISLYVHCTYTCIDVNICLDTVQTRLASLSSALEPLFLSSRLPGTSLFNWQTTQAWFATPKLPQPQVHPIHIAAPPAIHCCSVTAAHLEVELCPPCWDNWLKHVCTLHIHAHTVYIHVHTLYMANMYFMQVPLPYLPLHSRLYHLWHRYVPCYSTGITMFILPFRVQTSLSMVQPMTDADRRCQARFAEMPQECWPPARAILRVYIREWTR